MASPSTATAWTFATVTEVRPNGAHGVSVRFEVPDRTDHLPGQHYVIRLTADDGYVAQRSYSIASAPSEPYVELGIDVLPDGEVSGFLAEGVEPGDTLEVRGPIGGYFVWDGSRPALGIGGGSGVVPFVSMSRFAAADPSVPDDRLEVVVAARTPDDLLYADELAASGATMTWSRTDRPGRPAGRLSGADLEPLLRPDLAVFVCGSAVFAETVSGLLLGLGVAARDVKIERFGPTG
ncbi:FAD-binding oxidoreductase [Jatrophihabitans sp. YIM 134969]